MQIYDDFLLFIIYYKTIYYNLLILLICKFPLELTKCTFWCLFVMLFPLGSIFSLLKKDYRFELRNLYQLGGIIGFVLGISYVYYFYSADINARSWSLAYWMSFMFISFFSASRIFEMDLGAHRQYAQQLIPAQIHFFVKVIFVFCQLFFYAIFLWFLMHTLMTVQWDFHWYWLLLLALCCLGISMVTCFCSFLSMQTSGSQLLVALISLPICFPLIGMSFSIGMQVIQPNTDFDFYKALFPLLGIDLFCAAMLVILVPLIWKS